MMLRHSREDDALGFETYFKACSQKRPDAVNTWKSLPFKVQEIFIRAGYSDAMRPMPPLSKAWFEPTPLIEAPVVKKPKKKVPVVHKEPIRVHNEPVRRPQPMIPPAEKKITEAKEPLRDDKIPRRRRRRERGWEGTLRKDRWDKSESGFVIDADRFALRSKSETFLAPKRRGPSPFEATSTVGTQWRPVRERRELARARGRLKTPPPPTKARVNALRQRLLDEARHPGPLADYHRLTEHLE